MSQEERKMTQVAENRKGDIVDQAMKLFAQKGYNGTTLDEIAEKMGITKAAIYYYFRNKGQIIETIMNMGLVRMNRLTDLDESILSPKEKLREFIRCHVELSTSNVELTKIIFEQINTLPKRTRDAVKRKEREVDRTLQNILQGGAEDRSFVVDDVKMVSYAILGLCIWMYHWYKTKGRLTPEQISEIVINLLENGYLRNWATKEKEI